MVLPKGGCYQTSGDLSCYFNTGFQVEKTFEHIGVEMFDGVAEAQRPIFASVKFSYLYKAISRKYQGVFEVKSRVKI